MKKYYWVILFVLFISIETAAAEEKTVGDYTIVYSNGTDADQFKPIVNLMRHNTCYQVWSLRIGSIVVQWDEVSWWPYTTDIMDTLTDC